MKWKWRKGLIPYTYQTFSLNMFFVSSKCLACWCIVLVQFVQYNAEKKIVVHYYCNPRYFCAVHYNAMQDGFVQFISMQCKMILCSNCTGVHYNAEWWSCGTGSTWQGVKGRYPTIIHPLTIRIFIPRVIIHD